MKTLIIVCASCLVLVAGVQAQTTNVYVQQARTSGIYLSAADFQHGKLTLPVNCNVGRSRVRMNDFLGRAHITVIHSGRKYIFLKDTIFGLRSCEGHDFRLFHRRLFEIEELKSVIIYRHIFTESGGGTKGARQVVKYYFSTGIEATILPLTRTALEETFPHNAKLHDLLEAQFHGGRDDVSTYDSFHHMFKINRVLQAAI